jgi:hypothetical protein
MGFSLRIVDQNHMFETSARPPIIVNNFDTTCKEDKDTLNKLLYTRYEGDSLDVLPSCDCGLLHGQYNVDIECPNCHTEVKSVTERPLESSLWLAPPAGVKTFMNPQVWIILSKALTHSGQNLLEWMCSPTYQPNGTITKKLQKLQDVYRDENIERGINTFFDRFDHIFQLIINFRMIKGRKQNILDLITFVEQNRSVLFTKHLPIPSRMGFITEKTVTGKYADTTMSLALDAVRTITGTVYSTMPLTLKVRQARAVKAISLLAEYYTAFISDSLGSKHGWFRKHVFGSRLHFSGRAVISSLSDNHSYSELYLPWSMSVMLFKTHLTSKLIRRGFTPNMCTKFLFEHTLKYHPLMDELFQELISEAPVMNGDGGIRVVLQRNPSLLRGSAQTLRVTKIKTDVDDNSISMSVLVLKAPNADFDGRDYCCLKTSLIAGNSHTTHYYNVAGNGERECLKKCVLMPFTGLPVLLQATISFGWMGSETISSEIPSCAILRKLQASANLVSEGLWWRYLRNTFIDYRKHRAIVA